MWLVDIKNWFIQEIVRSFVQQEPTTTYTVFGPIEIVIKARQNTFEKKGDKGADNES